MAVKLIGAAIGLILAVVEFAFLQRLSERVELADTRKVLRVVGLVQLLILPLIGWFVAPLVMGDA
ncbi:MAG: hypothetical protein AB3N20_02855 [Rhizobiaceae bacterium]